MLKLKDNHNIKKAGILIIGLLSGMESFLVLGGSLPPDSGDDWPMFMHDPHHTSYTEDPGPLDETLLWVYDFSSPLYSSPVVKDGVVFQGSREYLGAFDLKTGALLWKTELAVVGSTPAVAQNALVVGTTKGFSAVDIRTGDILWTYDLRELRCVPGSQFCEHFVSSPVVTDERVFVGTGTNFFDWELDRELTRLLCLDLQSGHLLWEKEAPIYVFSSAAVLDNIVFFTSAQLEAVDIDSGKEIWYYHPSELDLMSDPIIVRGIVIASGHDGIVAADVNSGEVVWKTGPETGVSSLATDGKKLVGVSAALVCLDADTGTILWEDQSWNEEGNYPPDFPLSSNPAIGRDRIYVGRIDGFLYCINLEDGTLLWKYQTGGAIVASPAVVGDNLIIGSTDGKLYCFGVNPEAYFEKAEQYKRERNAEKAKEFYLRARDYYYSQGDLEMAKKCEERIERMPYAYVVLIGFCAVLLIILLWWKRRKPRTKIETPIKEKQ